MIPERYQLIFRKKFRSKRFSLFLEENNQQISANMSMICKVEIFSERVGREAVNWRCSDIIASAKFVATK